MANPEAIKALGQGAAAWKSWRESEWVEVDLTGAEVVDIDLSGYDFSGCNLSRCDFSGLNLSGCDLTGCRLSDATLANANLNSADLTWAKLDDADLTKANLVRADLTRCSLCRAELVGAKLIGATLFNASAPGCDFSDADLSFADLREATLTGASFQRANLSEADLSRALCIHSDLSNADLSRAKLQGADLIDASFRGANLRETNLTGGRFCRTDLSGADLTGCDLSLAVLVEADLTDATITGARIYGTSAWDVKLTNTTQHDLIISREDEPVVTVDDLEVGQFIYLMLNNTKIRNVIDTVTSKAVLILGRFADPQRKAVLDGLRQKLREFNLLPMVFDFDRPTDKDYTETVQTLAGMSMFVIADVTLPKSTPLELQAIVTNFKVPFLPIIDVSVDPRPFAMLVDSQNSFDWVLQTLAYKSKEHLLENLKTYVIDRAMAKREELRKAKNKEPKILEMPE